VYSLEADVLQTEDKKIIRDWRRMLVSDLTYYMYYFDKETCDFLREQIIGENVTETWATGLVETETNLWDIVRSLMKKEKQGVMDLKEETEAIREKLKEQEILLNAKADRIILSLAEAKNIMEALI